MTALPYHHLALTMQNRPQAPVFPQDTTLQPLSENTARTTHDLLVRAYAHGGGSVADFNTWYTGLINDEEFDPLLAIIVLDANQQVIAFIQCWNSAFIKDLVVDEKRRYQGLGEALLHYVLGIFFTRNQKTVRLKVEKNNPSGAEKLYKRLGFQALSEAQ